MTRFTRKQTEDEGRGWGALLNDSEGQGGTDTSANTETNKTLPSKYIRLIKYKMKGGWEVDSERSRTETCVAWLVRDTHCIMTSLVSAFTGDDTASVGLSGALAAERLCVIHA